MYSRGVSVDHGGVADHDEVEPAAAAHALRGDAHLVPTLLEQLAVLLPSNSSNIIIVIVKLIRWSSGRKRDC